MWIYRGPWFIYLFIQIPSGPRGNIEGSRGQQLLEKYSKKNNMITTALYTNSTDTAIVISLLEDACVSQVDVNTHITQLFSNRVDDAAPWVRNPWCCKRFLYQQPRIHLTVNLREGKRWISAVSDFEQCCVERGK